MVVFNRIVHELFFTAEKNLEKGSVLPVQQTGKTHSLNIYLIWLKVMRLTSFNALTMPYSILLYHTLVSPTHEWYCVCKLSA